MSYVLNFIAGRWSETETGAVERIAPLAFIVVATNTHKALLALLKSSL